ncbi:hypothetical protein BTN49_2254 [Candidatus Enterovibrio escicola]|uniref:Uncharacterized protein n=1 Tax=Candidatus Enterovibrio escicola TaxID=1927127 RepID=A0A2A5T207_9GAMM|nr:hypothetical protein BTN49_2254 [Candidatus Enterovibrio escacola]
MTVPSVRIVWDIAFYLQVDSEMSTAKCSKYLAKEITLSQSLFNIKPIFVI